MAIVVEEKRNSSGLINLLIWLVVLGIIGASVYYIFFKKPELIEFTAAPSFKNVQQLSKINLNAEDLVNNPAFQALKQYITITAPEKPGRSNPFMGF